MSRVTETSVYDESNSYVTLDGDVFTSIPEDRLYLVARKKSHLASTKVLWSNSNIWMYVALLPN